MTVTMDISWDCCAALASATAQRVRTWLAYQLSERKTIYETVRLYGVPRGGIHAASLVLNALQRDIPDGPNFVLTEDVRTAHIVIDDLIDSGATWERYKHADRPFLVLLDKNKDEPFRGQWVSFPWERMSKDDGPEDNVRRILEYIGEDTEREGLKETPKRVVRSYAELYRGYKQDVKDHIKSFESESYDEMVLVKDIEFYSVCEHHMQPFFGKAAIAYIPNGKVIGVSKLARILEVYARRLQIQERLCAQVTDALMEHLQPKGAACVLEAQHFCMICRGVSKQNSRMITSSLQGVFREPAVRQEFLNFIQG